MGASLLALAKSIYYFYILIHVHNNTKIKGLESPPNWCPQTKKKSEKETPAALESRSAKASSTN